MILPDLYEGIQVKLVHSWSEHLKDLFLLGSYGSHTFQPTFSLPTLDGTEFGFDPVTAIAFQNCLPSFKPFHIYNKESYEIGYGSY